MELQDYLNPFDGKAAVARYYGQKDRRINRALLDTQAIMNNDVMSALMDQVQDVEKVCDAVRFLVVGGFMVPVRLYDGTVALVPSREWLIDVKEQDAE